MERPFRYLIYLILATLLVSSCSSNCERLSTVFVLETSDSNSDSVPTALVGHGTESSSSSTNHHNHHSNNNNSNNKSLAPENTRIITDDTSNQDSSSLSPSALSTIDIERPLNDDHKQSDTHTIVNNNSQAQVYPPQHNQQQQQTVPGRNNNNGGSSIATRDTQTQEPIRRSESSTSRRIEDETPSQTQSRLKVNRPTTTERVVSNTNQQSAINNNQPQQRIKSTTSSYDTAYGSQQQQVASSSSSSTPKTEERLLISIMSDDDDYKPPQKHNIGSSSSLQNDELNQNIPQQQQQHQILPPKRKPSITISIQDSNTNKQNGGSGQAVIVRPSENGQSIVISTVGGATLDTGHLTSTGSSLSINQNNKYNQNKPPSLISSSQNEPYREPLNDNSGHHQPIHHQTQHTTSTTTYRPSLVNNINTNNDYNPPANINRPITSTLIDQPPRLPALSGGSGSDERPHRPKPISEEDYGSSEIGQQQPQQQQRPTSRPINRPISTDGYGQESGISSSEDFRPPSSSSSSIGGNQQQQETTSRFPLNEKNCGLVHETRIVGGEEADPDDFLWMAAIVKSKPSNGEARPFCGGSLITRRHILTAAHCLENLAPRDVLVRLGSYDFDDSTASSLSMDYAIDQFRVPAQYSKKTHVADIAIMRLKTPLSTNDNYKTVCMPQPRRSYVGALGTVTGYGSQSQTFRRAAPKLRQVTVPIWENRKCSVVYKKNLTESFLCAGYEEGGKDACQGDSGGPIMTEGPNERMMVVGVVSHGIGCGSPGYPGVYTRTTTFLDWIEKNTRE